MFHEETVEVANGFVRRVEQGVADGLDARYCRIDFDLSKYSIELFHELKVTLPTHIERAVRKRQAEYLAGRLCCSCILQRIGVADEVYSAYPDRQPVWPPGVAGSISHCAMTAIAVIASERAGHVGVDIEEMGNDLIEAHADMYTSIEEREHLTTPLQLLIAFSAKESLFKALYPTVKSYFGFECAFVRLIDATHFSVELTCTLGPAYPRHRRWLGHYCTDASAVTTLLMDINPASPISHASPALQVDTGI